MSIKAVIFDLDGTITQPFFDFDAIREEMRLDGNCEPILEAMQKMSPRQRKHAEKILHYHEQRAVVESKLNDGARETLESLRNAKIKIGILTRNKRCNALAIAQKHGLQFDAVVDRDDGPVKPDVFGVLQICEKFGIRPEEALMVGDYLFDLQCARAAGAVAVLLKNHREADEFTEYADFVIENITEIIKIIEGKN